jgi:hypothetical protein
MRNSFPVTVYALLAYHITEKNSYEDVAEVDEDGPKSLLAHIIQPHL